MFDFIRGTLVSLSPVKAVLEAHGVGYILWIPVNIYGDFLTKQDQEVLCFTSFVVREDSQRLFGFLHRNERDAFETLSEVSGIGPKTALGIIGHLSLKDLEMAIVEQDLQTLSKVPGIGKKTAERLIVEMKDKLKHLKPEQDLSSSEKAPGTTSLMQDALAALTHLGYHHTIAHQAIKTALKNHPSTTKLAELITLSLKCIHTR